MSQRASPAVDPDLFPGSFLRLLSVVPAAVRRLHAGVADGRRAVRGEGGRFFFRGHREYRPGDDIRRIDWRVEARLGKLEVRQFDAQKDVLTEVWLDGSASMLPCDGRGPSARAAALCCATGLGEGGRIRLGVLRDGKAVRLLEVSEPRQPCSTFAAVHRRSDLPRIFADAGWPGIYFRVLEDGEVGPGDAVEPVHRDPAGWTVRRVFDLVMGKAPLPEDLDDLLALPALAESTRAALVRRAGSTTDEGGSAGASVSIGRALGSSAP